MRARVSGWKPRHCRAGSAALAPLTEVLAADVMTSETLHGDDTPVPVLAPGSGKTKTGRIWTYVRDERPFASPIAKEALDRFCQLYAIEEVINGSPVRRETAAAQTQIKADRQRAGGLG